MPTLTIHDLLQIPPGTNQPHPYQVFGLGGGEQDASKIDSAVRVTILRLKEAKDSTDPRLWSDAAKLVQQAKQVLADPLKKSQLDARFGIVGVPAPAAENPKEEKPAVESSGVSSTAQGTTGSGSSDPLAAVLPPSDPLASVLPPMDPLAASLPSADPLAPLPVEPVPVAPVPVAPVPMTPVPMTPVPVAPVPVAPVPVAPAPVPVAPVPVRPGNGPLPPTLDPRDSSPAAISADMLGPGATTPAVAAPSSPGVVVRQPSRAASRRRKSALGTLLLVTFAVGMLALIGGLGYFLFLGSGELLISSSNEGLAISAGSGGSESDAQVGQPKRSTLPASKPPRDSVMGSLGPVRPLSQQPSLTGPLPSDRVPLDSVPADSTLSDSMPGEPMSGEPMSGVSLPADPTPSESMPDEPAKPEMTAEPAKPEMTDEPIPNIGEPPSEGDPAMSPTAPPPEMTEQMVASAEEKIQNVVKLLRTARWKEMKTAAEKLSEEPLTKAQQQRAEDLYELADLASYYRGGIERGVASLTVGNDFEVADSFRVIVVETGDDLLVVRFDAKNRSYTLDKLPFAFAHTLATFSMPAEAATTLAAKAAYQALAPKATNDYREQAIEWLEEIDEEVEGADPKRVAETIQRIFGDGASR